MPPKKNNYISIAKGIGIILMVIGHCDAPMLFTKYVYQFHMPLFFFCSGYFLNNIDNRTSLMNFYKKRIKGIYIKFLLWSLLFLALHNVFFYCNIYNDIVLFQGKPSYLYSFSDFFHKAYKIALSMNEHEQLLRSFWFLKQLFLSTISVSTILYIANKLIQHKYAHPTILAILFLLTLISKYCNWSLPAIWDISLVFMSSTFYYSGYIFHNYNIIDNLKNKYILVILFFISIIGLFCLPWTNMLEYTSRTAIPFFIVAYCGIIITLCLSKMLEKNRTKYLLYYLGQNTMIIFALHMLCFKIGNLIKIAIYDMPIYRLAEFQIIHDHNSFFWIIYTIIGIIIPLSIDHIMKKTIATKKIWSYFV